MKKIKRLAFLALVMLMISIVSLLSSYKKPVEKTEKRMNFAVYARYDEPLEGIWYHNGGLSVSFRTPGICVFNGTIAIRGVVCIVDNETYTNMTPIYLEPFVKFSDSYYFRNVKRPENYIFCYAYVDEDCQVRSCYRKKHGYVIGIICYGNATRCGEVSYRSGINPTGSESGC